MSFPDRLRTGRPLLRSAVVAFVLVLPGAAVALPAAAGAPASPTPPVHLATYAGQTWTATPAGQTWTATPDGQTWT